MTEQEMNEFASGIAERLKTDEAIEVIAKDFEAKVGEVPAEKFQEFARILVADTTSQGSGSPEYKQRLHQLNVLAVKMPAYTDVIERYHKWKTESGGAAPADPR
jgi:hypothetical protein